MYGGDEEGTTKGEPPAMEWFGSTGALEDGGADGGNGDPAAGGGAAALEAAADVGREITTGANGD